MVELRWAVPAHTTAKAPRLQYRQLPGVVSFGGPGWSEWVDVPYVVVQEESKPAPTAAHGFGVAAPPAVSTPYQFWLIERGPNEGVSQHQWWNEGPDGRVMGWKSSVHEATRYPSKEAAERVVSANRGLRDLPTSVTSHSFVDAADGVNGLDGGQQ